jgi:hypothetical protein
MHYLDWAREGGRFEQAAMETGSNDLPALKQQIHDVLFGLDDERARKRFIERFGTQLAEFETIMATAYQTWRALDERFAKDRDSATVVASVFAVLARMVLSMKLLILGHVALSGAAYRQVLEALAQAFLFAAPRFPYLKQAWNGQFSPNKAVDKAMRRRAELGLNRDALDVLRKARDFYNMYSHAGFLAMGDLVDLDGGGGTNLGASFDPRKLPVYEAEVASRVNLAKTLVNAMDGVATLMRRWPQFLGDHKP